jgi:hypothetical protein
MFRTVSVLAALVVGLCVASARAQTPFGGDDTGIIPPAKSPIAKCEAGAAKAEGKLIACILKCHASRASGKLADDTAENACETGLAGKSCFASFTLAISKLKGCPACINGTTMGNLAGLTESVLDGNNAAIYCGGAPTTTSTTTTTTLPTCQRLATIDCTNPTCPWCGQAFCSSQPPTSHASCPDVQGLCTGSIIPGNCTSADCASQCLDCDNGLQPCQ